MRGIVFCAFILIQINAFSQPESNPGPTFKKNAFYLSAELGPDLLSTSLNYERNLLSPNLKFMRFLNARLAYGRWMAASSSGSN